MKYCIMFIYTSVLLNIIIKSRYNQSNIFNYLLGEFAARSLVVRLGAQMCNTGLCTAAFIHGNKQNTSTLENPLDDIVISLPHNH